MAIGVILYLFAFCIELIREEKSMKNIYLIFASIFFCANVQAQLIEPVEILKATPIQTQQRVVCDTTVYGSAADAYVDRGIDGAINNGGLGVAEALAGYLGSKAAGSGQRVERRCTQASNQANEPQEYLVQYKHRGYVKEARTFCNPKEELKVNAYTNKMICD